jgi:hypothetical protein
MEPAVVFHGNRIGVAPFNFIYSWRRRLPGRISNTKLSANTTVATFDLYQAAKNTFINASNFAIENM